MRVRRHGDPGVVLKNEGESNPNAWLKRAAVRRIRRRWADGATQAEIAREEGVHRGTVCKIVYRVRSGGWASVE